MPDARNVLRVATAGDVDDGKSTLIGRLLFDSHRLFADQYQAVQRASLKQGSSDVNLALVMDGLKAEREQGITIDVARRYFDHHGKRFILADCPGHARYTKNMVSGSVDADVLLLLIDAVRGVTEQTRRHLTLAVLFEVPAILICINKIDLYEYKPARYQEIVEQVRGFLPNRDLQFMPLSALLGKNVNSPAAELDWYQGPCLTDALDALASRAPARQATRLHLQLPRFVAQHGARKRLHFAYLEAGELQAGQRLRAVYAGETVTLQSMWNSGQDVKTASRGTSLVCQFESHIDLARGEVLIPEAEDVSLTQDFTSRLVWFAPKPAELYVPVDLQFGSRRMAAQLVEVLSKFDLATGTELATVKAPQLNEVVRVRWRAQEPLLLEGLVGQWLSKFIIIDRQTRDTVGVGILDPSATKAH